MDTIDCTTLFLKEVPILLKLQNESQKHPSVSIRVSNKPINRSNQIEIQLTDQTNPFFLFQLSITEEDFHQIKIDQNLLIDYSQFTLKFIELLDACLKCFKDEYPK